MSTEDICTSFRLTEPTSGNAQYSRGEHFEAIHVVDGRTTILRLSSWSHDKHTLEFTCEQWCSSSSSDVPKIDKKQVIRTDESSTNWSLYARPSVVGFVRLAARPTMFNDDGSFLRIGSQLFSLDAHRAYQPLAPADATFHGRPSYFEEFTGRGAIIALASRAETAAQPQLDEFKTVAGFGETFLRLEALASDEYESSDSDEESDEESNMDELSDASSESDGHESWSEGSTDVEEGLESDLDEVDSAPADSSSSSSSSDVESVKTPEDEVQAGQESRPDTPEIDAVDNEQDTKSLASEDSEPPSVISAYGDSDSDEGGGIFGAGNPFGIFRRGPVFERNGSHALREPEMLLTIFDTHTGAPRKLFQYKHPLTTMLYSSPPAIHPHKSLVVWPLGAGDILFADFVEKTYFVRELRPSVAYSRNISVKVHFSACGQYLHIAALEAQPDDGDERRRSSRNSRPEQLSIHLLLSTYRLSSHKTARSPPSLVHRVKVALGKHNRVNVLQLPFTFTWTANHLFVAQRATKLSVIRISLYRTANLYAPTVPEHHVFRPKSTASLPGTSATSSTHFIPSSDSDDATVVSGSESRTGNIVPLNDPSKGKSTRGMLSPPVGYLVNLEKDLGGWERLEDVPVAKGQGVGKLDPRRERLYFLEGCDVEPWIEAN